ncbi:MAG TPA: DUF4198 domain-containing protein [Thermoanaerobaculia bacterium]|jgi:uncharacterized GH25 family protein|nr:DUF4198 domain-containing protein [Thermoanaerobaculia bacterium]
MSRRAALSLKIVALALLVSAGVQAHDFWIDPSSFRPAPGQRVLVRLRVGQKFKGDPMPRDPKLLRRFSLFSGNGAGGGETPVPGVAGAEPAGFATVTAPGLHLITYASARSSVELDAAKFEAYLADEGLETIKAQRARKGQTAAPAKEVFSRYAKSYLAVGGAGGPGYDRVLGLTLELVPEKDPTALAPLPQGTELPVRLLYLGKPLPGVLVAAFTRDQPDARVTARTDAAGRARLRLDRPGVWLVKAVHMIPAPADAGADWESFWASLTFETVKSS